MKEEEIRPQELFDELLRLNKEDIAIHFNNSDYKKIKCPACGDIGNFVFNKNGFNFDECYSCKTLYVSPRPDKKSFDSYYTNSKSTEFWATTFYKATEQNRREKIWKHKAMLIKEKIEKFSQNSDVVVDIGGGYGIFMEEFLKISNLNGIIIEPSNFLSNVCREKKLTVIEKFLENINVDDLPKSKKTFVSFELFEHLHNPKTFLEVLYKLMDNGDSFIFTTLSGMGVDIQSLWEHSKAVSPPMHLNFFNPKSIEILLINIGFEVLEVSTPGLLDIDIMNNNKAHIQDRFWKNFLDYSSENEKKQMQEFISNNKLSSHMMIEFVEESKIFMLFGNGEVSISNENKIFKSSETLDYDFLLFCDSRGLTIQDNSYKNTYFNKLIEILIDKNISYLAISRPKNLTTFVTLYNFLKLNENLKFKNLITNLGFVDCTPKKNANIEDILLQIKQFHNFDGKICEQELYTLNEGSIEILKIIEYSKSYIYEMATTLSDSFEKAFFINTPLVSKDTYIERQRPKSFFSQLNITNDLVNYFVNFNTYTNKLIDIQDLAHTYDGVHYTTEGHKIIFENILKELKI